MNIGGCGDCACRTCLMWWSNRCPHGDCYDDHRAKVDPYDKAHPNNPPRKTWTNWATDQAFWCRGGICYPVGAEVCEHYVKYVESEHTVSSCLEAVVSRFQDGYMTCGLGDDFDCEKCYRRFNEKMAALDVS